MPPLQNFAAIEFPGILRDPGDPSRALAALGGVQAVQNYVDTLPTLPGTAPGTCLTLNLRPSNLVSQSNITADPPRKTTQLFLVRLPPSSGSENVGQNCKAGYVEHVAEAETAITPGPNPPAGVGPNTAVIVGRVSTFTEFHSLADFQYHPAVEAIRSYSTSHPSSSSQSAGPYEESQHRTAVAERVFHCLLERPARNLTLAQCIDRLRPQRIARSAPERGTANYWYRQYSYIGSDVQPHDPSTDPPMPFIPGESLGFDGRSDPRRFQRLPHRVPYSTDVVPKNPPLLNPPVLRGRAVYAKLVSLLRLLFKKRPIWLRRALFLGVPPEFRPSFKSAINNVAYSFQGTGPFFQACIKYGYDPRKDPNSRKYQVLEVRCSHPLFEAVRQTREQQKGGSNVIDNVVVAGASNVDGQDVGPANITLDLFKMPSEFILEGVPYKKNNFYQICDMMLSPLKEFLREQKPITTYDSRSGFFTQDALGKVHSEVKVTLLKEAVQFVGEERAKQVLKGDLTAESMLRKSKGGRLKLTDVMKIGNMDTTKEGPIKKPTPRTTVENKAVTELNETHSEGDSGVSNVFEGEEADVERMSNSLLNDPDDADVVTEGVNMEENLGVEVGDECFPVDGENDGEDVGEREGIAGDLLPFEIYGSDANAGPETNDDGMFFGIDSNDEEDDESE